jgi:hypothetical protein
MFFANSLAALTLLAALSKLQDLRVSGDFAEISCGNLVGCGGGAGWIWRRVRARENEDECADGAGVALAGRDEDRADRKVQQAGRGDSVAERYRHSDAHGRVAIQRSDRAVS